MPDVELVVTDLDGTFWHTDDHVHDRVLEAVRRLQGAGVAVLVATGRRRGSTRAPLARIGLAPPAVMLNGALGVHLSTGEQFHRAPFSPDEAAVVLDAFRAGGLDPCVYVEHPSVEVFVSTTPGTHPRHLRELGEAAVPADLDQAVVEHPVLAFGVIGVARPAAVSVARAVEGLCEIHLDRALDFPGATAVTIAPRGQSKWDGVVAYCRTAGLDPSRVLVLGDGPNDIELLTNAAVRLVPEDGHAEALALADRVIPSPKAGGWAAVLDVLEV